MKKSLSQQEKYSNEKRKWILFLLELKIEHNKYTWVSICAFSHFQYTTASEERERESNAKITPEGRLN